MGPTIPAYGIWARHVKGLKLHNISFRLKTNDLRPVFICEDGKDIGMNSWKIPEAAMHHLLFDWQMLMSKEQQDRSESNCGGILYQAGRSRQQEYPAYKR